jgi:ABC-2 type transport system ATP-binding protein
MDILKLKEVTKKFNKKLVLDNISLTIPENKIFGIIGMSGSGKTTLLKLLVGYYKPTSGSVLFKGENVKKNKKDIKKTFGYASQDTSFYGKLTVKENMYYFGNLYGLSSNIIKRNTERILRLLKLSDVENIISEDLSGGMQKRLDIACALINYPKVLILDEPTEDVDPLLRREMLNLIKSINKLGTTIIITSHLLWEMEHLCDEIAIINDTKIAGEGDIDQLRKKFGRQREVYLELVSKDYDSVIKQLKKNLVQDYRTRDHKLLIYTDNEEEVLKSLMAYVKKKKEKVIELGVRQPSLNEIFEGLTEKKR